MRWSRSVVLAFTAACAGLRQSDPPVEASDLALTRMEFEEVAALFRADFFSRDTVPAFTLTSIEPQTQERAGVRVTVAPVRAEDQPWNTWTDGTVRLFNDSVGYLWTVRVEGTSPARWDPARTSLAVNDSDQVYAPAVAADELLLPVLVAAADESALGARGDLALRARSADEFRRAYLPTASQTGRQEGVVVFPAQTRHIHAVAMELRLALVLEGEGRQDFRFLFE